MGSHDQRALTHSFTELSTSIGEQSLYLKQTFWEEAVTALDGVTSIVGEFAQAKAWCSR